MKIIRAQHLGMCFGVRDALALAHEEAARGPLSVLGDLVHNETVLAELRARGVRIERDPEDVKTASVMITAHGASRRRLAEVRDRGYAVFEATCPLVHHAHRQLEQLVARGLHPVVIGQRGHVEVRGLTEDYPECAVVLSEADVAALPEKAGYGVVAQTTQPVARVQALVDALRRRFPSSRVEFRDTVCQPTKLRQQAAIELARGVEVVVVVGGRNSNNTRELAQTCASQGVRVHQIVSAEELDPAWFRGVQAVGLTAGTSTPDAVIEGVQRALERLAQREEALA